MNRGQAWEQLGAQGSLLRNDTRPHVQGQSASNLHPSSVTEAAAAAVMMVGMMVSFL